MIYWDGKPVSIQEQDLLLESIYRLKESSYRLKTILDSPGKFHLTGSWYFGRYFPRDIDLFSTRKDFEALEAASLFDELFAEYGTVLDADPTVDAVFRSGIVDIQITSQVERRIAAQQRVKADYGARYVFFSKSKRNNIFLNAVLDTPISPPPAPTAVCPVCGAGGEDLIFRFYCSNIGCRNFHK